MTDRLYYGDAYLTAFDARIVEHIRINGLLAVVLDGTYFYPTSGGQPHDKGTINGVEVADVTIRPKDGAIVHLLADEIWGNQVHAEIDWPRRFDHMQQHSGQHILSAAFLRAAGVDTTSFHLGADSSTIDLEVRQLPPATIEQAEDLANEVIYTNQRFRSTILKPDQLAQLAQVAEFGKPLRKLLKVDGPVRVVEVEDFDLVPCGGTHVRRAGEIGMIKIVRLDRRARGLRVEFRCGQRALADYRFKNTLVNKLSSEFTVGQREVDQAVDRLRHEAKSLRSEVRRVREQLLGYEAQELLQAAEPHGRLRVVSAVFSERDRDEISSLSRTLTDQAGVVVLFGVAGVKSHVAFARASDVESDMRLLLRAALRVLGSSTGGGRPEMAQGGGPAADERRVEQAIQRAKRLLLAQRPAKTRRGAG